MHSSQVARCELERERRFCLLAEWSKSSKIQIREPKVGPQKQQDGRGKRSGDGITGGGGEQESAGREERRMRSSDGADSLLAI